MNKTIEAILTYRKNLNDQLIANMHNSDVMQHKVGDENVFTQSPAVFLKYIAYLPIFPILFVILPKAIATYQFKRLVLTKTGVLVRNGVFNTAALEIPYRTINTVVVMQSIWGKLFNYGNIAIYTGNSVSGTGFEYVQNPYQLKQAIEAKLS